MCRGEIGENVCHLIRKDDDGCALVIKLSSLKYYVHYCSATCNPSGQRSCPKMLMHTFGGDHVPIDICNFSASPQFPQTSPTYRNIDAGERLIFRRQHT